MLIQPMISRSVGWKTSLCSGDLGLLRAARMSRWTSSILIFSSSKACCLALSRTSSKRMDSISLRSFAASRMICPPLMKSADKRSAVSACSGFKNSGANSIKIRS